MDQEPGLAFSDKIKLFTAFVVGIFSIVVITQGSHFNFGRILESGSENNRIIGWSFAGFFVFMVFYSLKKRKLIMFYGTLSLWYDSHFYIGLIGVILWIIHSEISLGFGLSKIISFFLLCIFFNGLYGVVVHFFIPEILLNQNLELIDINEIRKKKEQFGEKLNQLMIDKSDSFKNIYNLYIKQCVQKTTGIVNFLTSNFINKYKFSNQLKSLAGKENELPGNERPDYHKLLDYYGQRHELANQMLLIRLMNNWLNYHISLTIILSLLVALHILSYYYY